MATHAVTGTLMYSGTTTTTDTDILTLTGFNTSRAGVMGTVDVENTHASAILYVATNGSNPTSSGGDGVVTVKPGVTRRLPVRTVGNGTAEIRLTGSAAATYNVVGVKAAR